MIALTKDNGNKILDHHGHGTVKARGDEEVHGTNKPSTSNMNINSLEGFESDLVDDAGWKGQHLVLPEVSALAMT